MLPDNEYQQALRQQVDRIIASPVLSRTQALDRLLTYLRDTTLDGHTPKAVEIAEKVFGRRDGADAEGMVRVAMHRLRGKLADFYADEGADEAWRLELPKGAYALQVEPRQAPAPNIAPQLAPQPQSRPKVPAWAAAALVSALVLAMAAGWWAGRRADPTYALRQSAMWSAVLEADQPPTLVLGDYYIFGERGKDGQVERLIREFIINSRGDLEMLKSAKAPQSERYVDLGLNYLPFGLGSALRDVSPVLRRGAVVPASQLGAQTLQNSDIVYLGYLSGLGDLGDPAFDGGRFTAGDTFDEIYDRKTHKHYIASSHLEDNGFLGEDYALITGFAGPGGHRVLIIAGTRDAALMGAARFATSPDKLAQIDPYASGAFEALIGVSAVHNTNIEARLIAVDHRPNPGWMDTPQAAPSALAH